MNFLNDLKIGTRLGVGFAAAVLLMLLLVLLAKVGLHDIGGEVHLINTDRYPKVRMVGQVEAQLNLQARAARNLLLMSDPAQREAQLKTIETARAEVASIYRKLESGLPPIEKVTTTAPSSARTTASPTTLVDLAGHEWDALDPES